jgi:hypothetical protein
MVGDSVKSGIGSIELRKTQRAGLHMVRLSGSGGFNYSLPLHRDGTYRMGPSWGHRVKEATEESDPIKRVLREMGIPVSVLKKGEEQPLSVSSRWYDNHHCPNGRATTRWVTDGNTSEAREEILEQASGYFNGGGCYHYTISGATYAIQVSGGQVHSRSREDRPATIVVWPGCDPKKLGDALALIIHGEGADLDFMSALGDAEKARQWVGQKFAGQVVDTGYRQSGFPGYHSSPLHTLCEKHGVEEVVGGLLHSDERAFLRALKEGGDVAIQYILSHYRVVAVKKGEELGLKFARTETPDWLGNLNSIHLPASPNWIEERGLEQLLKNHNLRQTLWQEATEKVLVSALWTDVVVSNEDVRITTSPPEEAGAQKLFSKEFLQALVCLSDKTRQMKGTVMSRAKGWPTRPTTLCIKGFLKEGSPAGWKDGAIHLPVQVGEKKNFVIKASHFDDDTWWHYHVWGVTVERTETGVTFSPFDNRRLYTLYSEGGGEPIVGVVI